MKKLLYCGCCWLVWCQSAFAIVPEDPKKSCEELGYKTTYSDCIAARGTPLLCPFYSLTNPLTSCYVRSCRGYSLTDDDLAAVASDGKTYREHTDKLSSCVVGVGEDKTTLYRVDSCKSGSLYQDGLCDVGCSSTRYPYAEHQGSLAGDMRSCSDERGEWFGYYTCNNGWVGGWKDTGDGHCNLASCSVEDYPYNQNPNEDENRGAVQTCKIGGNAYYRYVSSSSDNSPTCTDNGYTLNWNVCSKDCKINNCSKRIKNVSNNGYEYSYNEWDCRLQTSNCRVGDFAVINDARIGIIVHMPESEDKRLLIVATSTISGSWGENGLSAKHDIPILDNFGSGTMRYDMDGKYNAKTILKYGEVNSMNYPIFSKVQDFSPSGCSSDVCAKGEWYIYAGGELTYIYNNRYVMRNAMKNTCFTQSELPNSSEWSDRLIGIIGFARPNWYGSTFYDTGKQYTLSYFPMLAVYIN